MAWRLRLAALVEGTFGVRERPGAARAGLGVPDDDERPGGQPAGGVGADDRAQLVTVARVVELVVRGEDVEPGHLVDLVDEPALAADDLGRPVADLLGRGDAGPVEHGVAGRRSGIPRWTSRPVSSAVSRLAATGHSSPGSSLPLAQDQSSYLRPVHHRDLEVAAAASPGHGPGSRDDEGWRGRHGVTRSRSRFHRRRALRRRLRWVSIIAVWRSVERLAARRRGGGGSIGRPRTAPSAGTSSRRPLLQQRGDLGDVLRVGDAQQRLDPAVEVAVHHVGAADEHDRLAVAAEPEDPGVLEEPAERRADRMFSLSPATPGRSAQMARTQMSTWTPACEAR